MKNTQILVGLWGFFFALNFESPTFAEEILSPDKSKLLLVTVECAPERSPYFITSNGLYLQAIQDALVSDFAGHVEFGTACPISWKDASFGGLHTSDGRSWSETHSPDGWTIES